MAKNREEELRAHGYMTPGEFVDALVPGLKEYLKHNWGSKPDELYHPEDLFSNAEIYIEVARHVAGDFIVAPKTTNGLKKTKEPKQSTTIKDLDAYCVYCKEKRMMVDAQIKTSDSGRQMAVGKCEVCDGKMNRILGKAK